MHGHFSNIGGASWLPGPAPKVSGVNLVWRDTKDDIIGKMSIRSDGSLARLS